MNLYSPKDTEAAYDAWGANCGPCSLAAMAGVPLEEICPHLGEFASRRYMNPTHMYEALKSLDLRVARTSKDMPSRNDIAMVFVQWGGPWLKPGVPVGAAYRNTHWIAYMPGAVYDVNVGHWVATADWTDPKDGVAVEILKHVPRADGTWSVRTCIHIDGGSLGRLQMKSVDLYSEVRP